MCIESAMHSIGVTNMAKSNRTITVPASISCDGTNDRPAGKWSGQLTLDFTDIDDHNMMVWASRRAVVAWAATARNRIPEFRSQSTITFRVPIPGTRGAPSPMTRDQLESRALAEFTPDELRAMADRAVA